MPKVLEFIIRRSNDSDISDGLLMSLKGLYAIVRDYIEDNDEDEELEDGELSFDQFEKRLNSKSIRFWIFHEESNKAISKIDPNELEIYLNDYFSDPGLRDESNHTLVRNLKVSSCKIIKKTIGAIMSGGTRKRRSSKRKTTGGKRVSFKKRSSNRKRRSSSRRRF